MVYDFSEQGRGDKVWLGQGRRAGGFCAGLRLLRVY